jgi:hypothetical protein
MNSNADGVSENVMSNGSPEGQHRHVARELLESAVPPSQLARRGFVLASLGFLAACASGGGSQSLARSSGSGTGSSRLPPGVWTSEGQLPPQRWAQPVTPVDRDVPPAVARATQPKRAVVRPEDKPPPVSAKYDGKIIARTQWTGFRPDPKEMNPLGSIRKITVHHTGNGPFTAQGVADVKEELQTVLRGERAMGHDDIAYHFIIDPAGRVWAGRDLRWQGSHVRNWKGLDNRTGNVGVMLLGNFERQKPSQAQLATLEKFVIKLQQQHKVPRQKVVAGRVSKEIGVFTHQQLSPTVCPGDNLQNVWERDIFKRLPRTV